MSATLPPRLAAAPTAVYAAGAGIFRSTDGGKTWTDLGTGLGTSTVVLALAIDPTDPATIYAGTTIGAFKSTDRGAHWTAIDHGLDLVSVQPPWKSAVTALLVDPHRPATVYAGTGRWGTGVFKSKDGGAHWAAINNGMVTNGNLDVRAMAMDPADPQTLYLSGVTGLSPAKTTDGGASWTVIPGPGFGFALAVDPAQPATIYAAGPFGVSKSVDAGASWTQTTDGLTDWFDFALAIDPKATQTVYLGAGGDVPGVVFKSTDGGAHWAPTSAGAAGLTGANAVAIDPLHGNRVYAGGPGGVFHSTDGGLTWNAALASHSIQAITMDPVTAQALLYNLTGQVKGLAAPAGPLDRRQVAALVRKLDQALKSVNQGKPKAACKVLEEFLDQVNAWIAAGDLTKRQGGPLIAQARAIMQSIPC